MQPKSASSQILEGLATTLPNVLNKFVEQKKEDLQAKELQEKYGIPFNIRDPKLREKFIIEKNKLDELAKNKPKLRAIEKAQGLSQGELEPFEEDLASAFKYVNSKKEKSSPGGYGAIPTNPEFATKFRDIKEKNPNANPTELDLKMIEAGIPPSDRENLLNNEREVFKENEKSTRKKDELLFKNDLDITKDVMKQNAEKEKTFPSSQQAINDIKNSAHNISWLDQVAEMTGFKQLQSSDAASLEAATKVFLMEDLKGMSGKINVYMEKMVKEALTDIKKSEESNLVLASGMQFRHDIEKAHVDFINQVHDEDMEKHGFVKGSTLQKRAAQRMEKYVSERQKMLEQEVKFIKKDPTNKKPFQVQPKMTRVKFPDGKIRLLNPEQLEMSKTVPGAEVVK